MEKSSKMRDRILEAVETLIASQGVNNISLKMIAESCGISKGTLYYYYQSKDAIILDLIEKHIAPLKKDYLEWLDRHKDDTISPERFLQVILTKGVKSFNRAKTHIYLINECAGSNPAFRKRYNELWVEWKETIVLGLKQVFPKLINTETDAYLIMLIIDGLVVQEVLESKDDYKDRIVKLISGVYRNENKNI